MASVSKEPFIPALHERWLTPLYDPLLKWVLREKRFKEAVVRIADPSPGDRILDVGCGTGTLTLMLRSAFEGGDVVGVDVDDDILRRARRKAQRNRAGVQFENGSAMSLPYSDDTFEKVVSCLTFHHLPAGDGQQVASSEIFRVLRPGGRIVLVDFGKPTGQVASLVARVVGRFEDIGTNLRGELPEMLIKAGFQHIIEAAQFMSVVGSLSLYVGWKEP